MSGERIIAILSLIGTLVGSIGGILISNRLTLWRLEQLEKKVDKHNCLVERMTLAENEIKHLHEVVHEKGN